MLRLVPVLALFLAYLAWLRPAEQFGRYHDDTIYFSSAKALAEGRGYVIPSLPGDPPQTKYPVLYPWVLSWVWRWNPAFPANLTWAAAVSALFACLFLVAAFRLLRGLAGVGEWTALGLTALCAFRPTFLYLGGAVLSDVPFAALALTAAVMADRALEKPGDGRWAAAAGVVAGLSVLTRSLGAAVVLGVVATALHRRRFRQGGVFLLAAAPFILLAAQGSAPAVPAGSPGFQQTWLFYTSYGKFWRLSAPNLDVLFTMVMANLQFFLEGPASQCLFPPLGGGTSYAGMMLSITLTAGILAGVVRQARSDRWRPIHFLFVFYAGAILLWNYAIMERFLLVFLPLFYAGVWVEGKHFLGMLRKTLRSRKPAAEKGIAGALAAGLAAVALMSAWHYVIGFRPLVRSMGAARQAMALEKDEAYEWIRRNTPAEARAVAYEDASLYLHTGRRAMRPMAFSTEAFYKKDEKLLGRELARLTDVASHIGARYWLMADDDFQLETGESLIHKRVAELKSRLPLLFRSSGGRVAVYGFDPSQDHQ